MSTLPGVKFIAVSPSHHLVAKAKQYLSKEEGAKLEALLQAISTSKETSLREGKQVGCLKLGSCIHPLTNEEIPVYIADYVLDDYGTGAVMGVPSGDERDQRLADKENISWTTTDIEEKSSRLILNWLQELESAGKIQSGVSCFSLRDWLVSRQRYWGTPIPIIHCKTCGIVPVPEKDLPVMLPQVNNSNGQEDQRGKAKQLKPKESDLKCICPRCGSNDAVREADTLDTFVDSSWYFLRFLDPHNQKELVSKQNAESMPVKAYIGGMEHAIKHLLYARFVNKFLFDLGTSPCSEPFENIITQGLVKGESYRLKSTGQYLTKESAEKLNPDDLIIEVEKMSKSKLNGISPIDAVEKYGVDCLKLALVFAGPIEKDITVSENLLASMVL